MLKTMIDLSRVQPRNSRLATRNALLANLAQVSFIELFEGKGLLLYDFALDSAHIEFFFRSAQSLAILYKR